MTHDLLKDFLDKFEINLEKIMINDVRDNTFYALLHCKYKNKKLTIDSRPSDAIALALRLNAPIFVKEEVVQKAQSLKFEDNLEGSEKLRTWLENLKPEDFGKYKM
jgi:bifunctional DNase/RNase